MNIISRDENYSISTMSTEQLEEMSVLDIYSYLLVEEAESIPQIVHKLSDEKLAAVIDLSSWDKDIFNSYNYTTWLKVILSMDQFEALRNIKRLDRAELILFIAGVTDIAWKEPDVNYEGNPYVSPDLAFLIYTKDGQDESELYSIAVSIINLAYSEDVSYGRSLCMDAMSAIYSALEEDCFRFKNARLSDEGVPTYLEALELYHYEDPTKLLSRILKLASNDNNKTAPSQEYVLSQHAMIPRTQWEGLLKIDPKLYDSVKIELGSLLTASIVLNNALDMNPVNISETAKRSVSYFKIGVELIRENYKGLLEDLLNKVELKLIFRLGFSLLVDLRKNANNVKTALDAINRPDIIDVDDQEFLKNLILPIPMFLMSLDEKPAQFDTLEQLKTARKKLSQIADKVLKFTTV